MRAPHQVGVEETGVEDEEDVVHGDGAQYVQPEPGLDVLHSQGGVSRMTKQRGFYIDLNEPYEPNLDAWYLSIL